MGLYKRANFVTVTAAQGYDSAATSIDLVSGDGAEIPTPGTDYLHMVWWNETDYTDPELDPNVELVLVTAKSGDTLTVTRGQNGTVASNKNASGKTYNLAIVMNSARLDQIETELQNGSFKWGSNSTGSAGAYAITLDPVPTAYIAGHVFRFIANHANTGAATLNVNGLGAKALKTLCGTALYGNEITSSCFVAAQYDGTDFRIIEIIAKFAIQNNSFTYVLDTGAANAYEADVSPTVAAYAVGLRIQFKAANANTGASTVNVNGLGVKNILRKNGEALVANDIRADSLVDIFYDGTQFVMLNCWVEGNQVSRAWIRFDGATPAITDSYNIDSLDDDGVGDYGINFDDNFGNADYCFTGMIGDAGNVNGFVQATNSTPNVAYLDIETVNQAGTNTDFDYVCVDFKGDR